MSSHWKRDFAKLWCGQTISEIGSRITREGLPLTAVLLLGATPGQMGVLSATSGAAVLLFGLASGVLVDRVRRRPVMIAADLGRAAILLTVPIAARLGRLSMAQLLAVTALSGVLTVLFDVAYQSYVPSLVDRAWLLEANRRLSLSSSTAEILGPALTGVLVKLITAPVAILIDAISFLLSAASVWAIRQPEFQPVATPGTPLRREILEGLHSIRAHRVLRLLCFRAITGYFFMGMVVSLYVLFIIRVLRLNTAEMGLLIALGGVGSVLGALLIQPLARRFHASRIFMGTALVWACATLLTPLSSVYPKYGALLLGAAQLFGDASFSIFFVNEMTLRQHAVGEGVLGRVNAAMQIASRGVLPFGALAGGFLGDRIGIAPTLWVSSFGALASCLWLAPLVRRGDHSPDSGFG